MDNETPRTPNTDTQTSRRLRIAKWVTVGALGFAGFANIGGHTTSSPQPGQARPNNHTHPSNEPNRIVVDDNNMGHPPPDPNEPGAKTVIDDSHMGHPGPDPNEPHQVVVNDNNMGHPPYTGP